MSSSESLPLVVTFVRHAESDNNRLARISMEEYYLKRVSDPLLTEEGVMQARSVVGAVELLHKELPFTRLYSSAFRRALATIAPVARQLGMRVDLWLAVHEVGGVKARTGTERGITQSALRAEFPFVANPEVVGEDGWWTGAKETFAGAAKRARQVVNSLQEQARSRRDAAEHILILSHGPS